MITPTVDQPLSDADYSRLDDYLAGIRANKAMSVEEMDGFFAAIICCPDDIPPSEYLPIVWGGQFSDEDAFQSPEEAQEVLTLILRHWNTVARQLRDDTVFLPLLFEDEGGAMGGNEWAVGFLRGVSQRPALWAELLDNNDMTANLLPILFLAHEHDPDPRLQPQPLEGEAREDLLVHLAASVTMIYRYFEPQRRAYLHALREQRTTRRTAEKIGRNEPCLCGSGRKYKRCCAQQRTVH